MIMHRWFQTFHLGKTKWSNNTVDALVCHPHFPFRTKALILTKHQRCELQLAQRWELTGNCSPLKRSALLEVTYSSQGWTASNDLSMWVHKCLAPNLNLVNLRRIIPDPGSYKFCRKLLFQLHWRSPFPTDQYCSPSLLSVLFQEHSW